MVDVLNDCLVALKIYLPDLFHPLAKRSFRERVLLTTMTQECPSAGVSGSISRSRGTPPPPRNAKVCSGQGILG